MARRPADQVSDALTKLSGDLPPPRLCLSDDEKIALITACGGPRTAKNIRKTMKTSAKSRIPHLFSAIDTQVVIDILNNEVDELIESMIAAKSKTR